ncbi:hypothetical protein IW261DRAFT_151756 [Armillaria novae-zelandiae]|uniref:Uncharacterized protein n=1 Tax=Armillaria novae-zelandiae TaxID=153914 RepID=A0AA39P8V9_9AGAR|nr:hypothetical protein IW261DRAFT_151756 [Armillaria novae-zelandiae]
METLPPEIETMILVHLNGPELVRYSTCSHLAFARASDTISRHYCTRKLLDGFFSTDESYNAFRETQRRHGVLVSGSQVAGFFIRDGTTFKDSDLDVYVDIKRDIHLSGVLTQAGYFMHADLSREHVIEPEDNELLAAMDDDEMILRTKYVLSAIASVKEYRNDEGKVVQVIASHGPPMDIILGFHSTCVMNVISYHYAYCLYPSATISDRVSIAHIGTDTNSACARGKWASRGWQMLRENTSSPRLDLRSVNRYVGDRYSWRIPCEGTLTVADVLQNNSTRPTDPVKAHSWQLVYSCHFDDGFYAIYAWFLLPSFHEYICISNKIMRRIKASMLTW